MDETAVVGVTDLTATLVRAAIGVETVEVEDHTMDVVTGGEGIRDMAGGIGAIIECQWQLCKVCALSKGRWASKT